MVEEVWSLAVTLGKVAESDQETLRSLCDVVVQSMLARLKSGIRVEDCSSALVLGGAWLALGQLCMSECSEAVESFTAGSLTIRRSESMSPSQRCGALTAQAERLLAPYLSDKGFCFLGVRG